MHVGLCCLGCRRSADDKRSQAPIKFEGGCGVELADLETGLPITILRPLEVQRRLGVGLGLEPRKEKDAGRGI